MWSLGLSIYTTTLLIVTIKLTIHIPRYTLYHVISIFLALLIFIATIYFTSISFQSNTNWINIKVQSAFIFSSPTLWLFIALGPIAACLPDTTFEVFSKQKSPKDFQIMQEMEHGWQDNIYESYHQNYVEQINDFIGEQVIEEDGINLVTNESLSNESIFIETPKEGGNIEINETSLLISENLLTKPNWEGDVDEIESQILKKNMLKNKNDNIRTNQYNSSPYQNSRVKFNCKFNNTLSLFSIFRVKNYNKIKINIYFFKIF